MAQKRADKRSPVRTGSRQGTYYMTEGNTVRAVRQEAEPYYERERRRRAALERSRRMELEAKAAAAKKRQTVSIPFPVLVVLIAAVSVTLYFGYQYLQLTASVDSHLSSVRSLETKLENLKTENDALEQSIDTSVDLSEVYDIAVNRLGMVHADAENVVRYQKTESQYVRQYEQIPEY